MSVIAGPPKIKYNIVGSELVVVKLNRVHLVI
jgi:hypothetical protein